VHTSTALLDCHVVSISGIPVTNPTRTLFDLSARIHWKRLERTIDNAWARRLTSGDSLHATFRALQRRGRPRIATMRRLLEPRSTNYVPPESGLEARFEEILRRHGLPPMHRQVHTGDDIQWLGRIDFRDADLPLVVQTDSETFHGSISDRRLDDAQTQALEAAGYVVARVREFDVWHRPERVATAISQARERARARRQRNSPTAA
jgi:very-short-patch-repair endonuclease